MKRKSHLLQNIFVAALTIIMILMSVGFAAYQERLNITGQTTVAANKWSVHFAPVMASAYGQGVELGDLSHPTHIDQESLTITIDPISLNKPSDVYFLVVPIINDGTFDARVDSVELTGIPPEAKAYINATVVMVYDYPCDITQCNPGPDESAQIKQTVPAIYGEGISSGSGSEFKPFVIPAHQSYPTAALQFNLSYISPDDPSRLPQEDLSFSPVIKINVTQV